MHGMRTAAHTRACYLAAMRSKVFCSALVALALVACGSRPASTTLVTRVGATPDASSRASAASSSAPPAPAASSASSPEWDAPDAPDVRVAIDAPPRPPSQPYVAPRAISPEAARCRDDAKPRAESFCLLKIAEEGTIGRLLDLGLKTQAPLREHQPMWFHDDAAATDNAGVIAAKTSERELFAMLRDPDPSIEGFALVALEHMLAILRMGYANGHDLDDVRLVAMRPRVADACAPFVGSDDVRVVLSAIRCLREASDKRFAPMLARVVVAHSSMTVKAQAAQGAWIAPLAPPIARRIAAFLETPMNARWYGEDVHARDAACSLLRNAVTARPAWIGHAAATAYGEMQSHGKGNATDGSCRRLAESTGAVAPTVEKHDWFPKGPIERCRAETLGAMGRLMVCVRSEAAGTKARRYEIAITDPSALDAQKQHPQVARFDLPVLDGGYVDVERVELHELSQGFFALLVPIVHGVPDASSGAHADLYLLDSNTRTLTRSRQLPACTDCTTQTLQIGHRPPEIARTIKFVQYKDIERPTTLAMKWDGAQLR